MYYEVATIIITSMLYVIILKPFIPLLCLKWQLGKKVILKFRPLGVGTQGDLFHNEDQFHEIRQLAKEQQVKIYAQNIGSVPLLTFYDQQAFKSMMNNLDYYDHHQVFNERYQIIHTRRLIGNGIFYTNGEQWTRQRNLLAKSFHFDQLKKRVPAINGIFNSTNIEQPFDVMKFNSSITSQVTIQMFFGEQLPMINGVKASEEVQSLFHDLKILKRLDLWHKIKHLFIGKNAWNYLLSYQEKSLKTRVDNLLNLISSQIDHRINQHLASQVKDDQDFLDIHVQEYIKTGKISRQEIQQQFLTLLLAGTDTTANTISTMIYYLAENQVAQDDLRQEVLSAMNNKDYLAYEDLHGMIKMNSFLQECLRLRNPANALIIRKVTQDHFIGDLKLKKGWLVRSSLLAQGMNPTYFPNPDKFIYTRFLNLELPPYVFEPFSAGKRNCVGQHLARMEAKIVVGLMLRKYRFKLKCPVTWKMTFLYGFQPRDAISVEPL